MPVLTTHQEPDDFDKPNDNPDEPPNEYAVRYLFTPSNLARDWRRTGRALILFGFIGSLIAFGIILGNLDFKLDTILWGTSGVILATQLLAWWRIRAKNIPDNETRRNWDWAIPLPLIALLVLVLLIWLLRLSGNNQLAYIFYFLPSAACTFLGGFFLFRAV
jgi:hypothetical protein